MADSSRCLYNFDSFCIDTTKRLLLRDGHAVPIPPKAFDTLLVLVENNDRVVEKGELMKAVWPDDFVEENNLPQNISYLRKALGERPEAHRFILTVPGKGYRFVSSVKKLSGESAALYSESASKWNAARSVSPVRTIAVLPFQTFGVEGPEEYLGLGIAEALTTRLGKTNKVTVRSTNAARNRAGSRENSLEMGRRLRVEGILDGSIQKWRDRIRVTVHLLRVSDGTELWAESFDERLSDIFTVEDRVSEQVAQALMLRLSGEEKRELTRRHTESSEAYHAYLKGRYFWNKRNEEGIQKGILYFQQAIDSDPTYALAYSGLADSYSMLGTMCYLPPKDLFPKAKASALKAIEMHESLAEAHTSLALVHLDYDWHWQRARTEFERALELNPNYATARQWYSECLVVNEGPQVAVGEVMRALEMDPLSITINRTYGMILFLARRYDQAIEQLEKTVELDRSFPMVNYCLGLAYAQKSIQDGTVYNLAQSLLAAKDPWSLAALGYAAGVSGQESLARMAADSLADMARNRYVSTGHLAMVHAGLGEKDKALDLLEASLEERFTWLVFLHIDPSWDAYRSSPRFQDLLQKVGLPV